MTSHELARQLLTLPDLPVYCNGGGEYSGDSYLVTKAEKMEYSNIIFFDFDETKRIEFD